MVRACVSACVPIVHGTLCLSFQALAYRERVLQAVPAGAAFEPLMTLYLTDNTPPEEVLRPKPR
jgi:dihydroorotase